MGVILWGESPLYMNSVPSFYDGSESTIRRQGHYREVVSEGSRSAKLQAMLAPDLILGTEIAYNPDYAAARVVEDARRRACRRTLVLQAS